MNRAPKLLFLLFFGGIIPLLQAQSGEALRRPISPEQPMWLIHIDTWNYADPQKIIDLVPKDIRPYVVMNISLSVSNDEQTGRFKIVEYGYETAKSWLRVCAENQMWAMVQPSSGAYSRLSDTDLSVYEEFYNDYPNMLGFNYSEQSWGYEDANPLATSWGTRMTHLSNLLELSNKYGGYLVVSWCGNQWVSSINPVAMVKRNSRFAEVSSKYKEHYIICEKYTFKSYQHDMESVCLGSWLSGFSGQYGIRYDDSGWTDDEGNNNEDFSMATYGAPFLEHVMLTGQTVIDGPELIWRHCFVEVDASLTSDGYSTRTWETVPQFDNVSIDLFRKVLDGTVRIPGRQEVIDRTQVVIINDATSGSDDDLYSSPRQLFDGLYRLDEGISHSQNKSFFKKTGRYPSIPTVYRLEDAIAQSFKVKVNASSYSQRWENTASKVSELNNLFPEEYTGDLYAGRLENSWVTYNPFKSGDRASAEIPFKYNTCEKMELEYAQYTAGVIKEHEDYLIVYLSNYDNFIDTDLKKDVIRIYGSSAEPTVSYQDRGAHKASEITTHWEDDVYTLEVVHNGPIDLKIDCSGNGTGRLTEYKEAQVVTPKRPSVYVGVHQYEAEVFDYKNVGSIIRSGYEQAIRNYTGQGYIDFGTNASAAVRDYVTVSNEGDYLLDIKYTVSGGAVNNIDLYVNGAKIASPSFTPTDHLNNWQVNSQEIALKKGKNTIEFKANGGGSRSIYFDNIVVRREDGSDIWLESECGAVGTEWETLAGDEASNGIYVNVVSGNGSTNVAPAGGDAQITYDIAAAESGIYHVWARVIVEGADEDAVWYRIDEADWILSGSIASAQNWEWVKLGAFELTEGAHKLSLGNAKQGFKLDKILLTQSDQTPSGKAGPASNCVIRNEAPIAFAGTDRTLTNPNDIPIVTLLLSSEGSADTDGEIVSYVWTEDGATIGNGSSPAVNFTVGEHLVTLTVTDDQGAIDTDDLLIIVQPKGFEYALIGLEAECAVTGNNWQVVNDEEVSNEEYVTVKAGIESTSEAPSSIDGRLVFSFTLSDPGNYVVYGLLNCPTFSDDSFWARIDDDPFESYNGLKTEGWNWVKFKEYELVSGDHHFDIGYREDGALIDKLFITNSPDLPVGFGVRDTICDPEPMVPELAVKDEVGDASMLLQNYPNPFQVGTSIRYRLSNSGFVELTVLNLAGQVVDTIEHTYQGAGDHQVIWKPEGLPEGVYFYQLKVGGSVETKRLIIGN